jgi:hypothetical protein
MRLIANNRLVDKPRIAPPMRMSTEKFNKPEMFPNQESYAIVYSRENST